MKAKPDYQENDYAVGDCITIGDSTLKVVSINENGQVTLGVKTTETIMREEVRLVIEHSANCLH